MRSTVTNTRLMELRKVVGNEFVDGLLKVFLDDAPVALSTIRGSADSEDLDALVFESHRLLSMCRNLGFDGMSTLCQRIEDEGLVWPEAERWAEALVQSALVRAPGEDRQTPLVLDGHRLYLDRAWGYQARLISQVAARIDQGRLVGFVTPDQRTVLLKRCDRDNAGFQHNEVLE